MDNIAAQIDETLRRLTPEGSALLLPPPVFLELEGQFTGYEEGRMLRGEYLALPKFTNPMGSIQGGIVGAALDCNYGTLAFLATETPHITVTMDTAFIRPILADGRRYAVEVIIRARTRTMLFLDGTAYTQEGKIAATSTTTMTALRPRA